MIIAINVLMTFCLFFCFNLIKMCLQICMHMEGTKWQYQSEPHLSPAVSLSQS